MATMWDDWVKSQSASGQTPSAGAPPSPYGMMPPAAGFTGMTSMSDLQAGRSALPPLPMSRSVGMPPGMNAPMPIPRPAMPQQPVGAPMQAASATPSVRESFMQRLLGGPDFQSNSMPVVAQPQGPMGADMRGAPMPMQANPMTAQQINWGDPENAADFFRADRALQNLPPEVLRGLLG